VFDLSNNSSFVFNQVLCPSGVPTFIQLTGAKTDGIKLVNTDTSNAVVPFLVGKVVKQYAVAIK
ncbi:MAG: glycoside hydrolase family 28, partial [Bacilli bacterium]|nr:glycoside hydrolase family 28 [Bacilli bacterium]